MTGCTGFIGFHLSKKLLLEDVPVLGIDRLISKDNDLQAWRLESLTKQGIQFVNANIVDKKELNKKIVDANFSPEFSSIYHLAGSSGVRQSVKEPKKYYQNNIIGTINMLNLATEFSGKSFVLASSSSVYGLQDKYNKHPFIEDDTIVNPQSPYAHSKLIAEIISKYYFGISSLNVTLLRFFTVYGPAGRIDMSILQFIHNIINRYPVKIFGNGYQERDYTYVEDICDGIILSSKLKGYQTLNLGSANPYSVISIVRILEKILKIDSEIEYCTKHDADVDYTWANIDKAKSLLNWTPKISLENGLEKTVDWYKKNQKWLHTIFG